MPIVYEERNWNKEHSKCPACNAHDKPKGGVLKIKGKNLICSRYPDCKYSTYIPKKKKEKLSKLLRGKTVRKLDNETRTAIKNKKRVLRKLKRMKKKILLEECKVYVK